MNTFAIIPKNRYIILLLFFNSGAIALAILEHIVLFFVCIALMLLAWLVFLFVNKYLSHLSPGLLQTFLGSANSLAIILALVALFGYFSISFSIGLMLLVAVLIGHSLVRKLIPSKETKQVA